MDVVMTLDSKNYKILKFLESSVVIVIHKSPPLDNTSEQLDAFHTQCTSDPF
jgi:hypothetical protein